VAVLRTFESNREIISLGDLLDSFYIVKQGVINVIKPTKRSLCVSHVRGGSGSRASLSATAESPASPGNWVLDRGWKDRTDSFHRVDDIHEPEQYVNFVVGVLGSGQFFGELAILNPERGSPLIVKTCTNVETYCIPSSVMFELGAQFQPATMTALDESMNLYNTPGEKLAYYFRHRLTWEQKKCKLLNQLLKNG
jgi:CRP-like cAMP-binding protein